MGVIGQSLTDSALLDAQSEIIDTIAAGTDLRQTLRHMAEIIERLIPPAICSILLVDSEGRIHDGGTPSLPQVYLDAIEGMPIGPAAGSCGTAAYRRQRVIVEDIETDPLWADYRCHALPIGLRACWSQPVLAPDGVVLGTFALYYRERQSPADDDLQLVERMARLVRVALILDRREQVLVETEQTLRDYLSLSSDWLWERTEQGGQFITSNSAGRVNVERLGPGSPLEDQIRQIEARFDASIAEDKANLRPISGLRIAFAMPDGETRYLNLNSKPVFDRDGAFRGYRGTAQDVSQQVAAEMESQRLRVEAQDANRAKTEFLANISHELRTPLNAILGFSEIMQGELLGPISDRYRQYAADIHQAGQHLHGLVTDILNLSRIEMGRIELEEEEVSVQVLVQDCAHMLRMRAEERGVVLRTELPADQLMIRCDRLRLKQSLLNLVSNAIKFTPKMGSVTMRAAREPDGLAITVTDTGIGMRPEDIPRAMEPFRQVGARLNQAADGVGLGLALAKSLVELHGGSLALESALGKGTTATIRLPASRLIPTETH